MNVNDGVSLFESIYITIFSMAMVFLTLMVIALILSAFKYLGTKQVNTQADPSIPAKNQTQSDLVSANHLETKQVAAIVAAIQAYRGQDSRPFRVHKIRRSQHDYNIWAMAGLQENTRPISSRED